MSCTAFNPAFKKTSLLQSGCTILNLLIFLRHIYHVHFLTINQQCTLKLIFKTSYPRFNYKTESLSLKTKTLKFHIETETETLKLASRDVLSKTPNLDKVDAH